MRLWLVLLCSAPVFGQAITAGIVGGVPVTNTFDTGGLHAAEVTAKTIRYTIGPAVDFRLFGPLGIEIDALFQPFSFRTFNEAGIAPTFGHTLGNLWQFPVLVKFRIPRLALKPFVDAGPSVQLASNITESSYNLDDPARITAQHPGPNAVAGLAAGGGFEFRLRPIILAPEVRYTRWLDENVDPFNTPQRGSHVNQLEVLLSIRI